MVVSAFGWAGQPPAAREEGLTLPNSKAYGVMPAALEAARKAAVLVGSQGHRGQVLFSRPAIALSPKATLLPVASAKALISPQRAKVRQKVVLGGQGAPGVS